MAGFLIYLIKLYKAYISPLTGNCCRFYPSCSTYAIQALEKYGALKGTLFAVYRILRCNPYNKHCGYDPLK